MTYIIDGHNLIPKIAGLSLSEMDDEARLINLLASFCQKKKTRVIVFFDKAAPGRQGAIKYGAVTAFFVSESQNADNAIHSYLISKRRDAVNLTVVSSDRQVQNDTRALRAKVQSSEAFARQLRDTVITDNRVSEVNDNEKLTPEEVENWEKIFFGYDKYHDL